MSARRARRTASNLVRRTISQPYPDHFRRRASHEAALAKVIVFGHDRESTVSGVAPDRLVVGGLQVDLPDGADPRYGSARRLTRRGERLWSRRSFRPRVRGSRSRGGVGDQATLAVGGEGQGGTDVLPREAGGGGEDLVLAAV